VAPGGGEGRRVLVAAAPNPADQSQIEVVVPVAAPNQSQIEVGL
jgi:hypothetical protein